MNVYELAKKYYPKLWDKERIQALAAAGKLTEDQAREITQETNAEYAWQYGKENDYEHEPE